MPCRCASCLTETVRTRKVGRLSFGAGNTRISVTPMLSHVSGTLASDLAYEPGGRHMRAFPFDRPNARHPARSGGGAC
jgi:hypothetical protein